MKKIVSLMLVIVMLNIIIGMSCNVYASEVTDVSTLVESMKDSSNPAGGDHRVAQGINNIIGLLQVVGTGISVIVVTILGIQYILASPSEKAEIKKMAMPIVIGCVLLFGAVNLVAAVADFSEVVSG